MTKRCFCSDAVFSRGLELLHPKPMQLVWKGRALFYTSHNTSGWGRAILRQKLKQAKSSKGARDRHSCAWAKPEKEMGENPSEEDSDKHRRVSLWYTVQGNQSWAWQQAAPRSVAPALCVQGAVVHQLQHDPAQAVITAVGNCYVSVPFQSLQE